MPGLVGLLSKDQNIQSEQLLERMIGVIKHRKGYKVDKYIHGFFAGARVHLGIFNREKQPVFNQDKSLCIFMDGKVYNHYYKRKDLEQRNQGFFFNNDLKFCLHLYEERGNEFVKELNGSFVIMIYNFKKNEVLIFNDRYGLRPHYYTIKSGGLLFAPEVKAILEDKNFKKEINNKAIADFFAFNAILGSKTFFKDIKVLPPASILTYNGQDLSIKQYWNFKYTPDYNKSESEFADELVVVFRKALKKRTDQRNVRFGITLSGGLDSRSTYAALEKNKRNEIKAYTFGPQDCDEVKIAKKVTKVMGGKHRILQITPRMIIENAEREVYLTDGINYIGVSYIPPIQRLLRKETEVILDALEQNLILGGDHLYLAKKCNKEDELFTNIYNTRLFSDEDFRKMFKDNYYKKIKDLPMTSLKEEFNKIEEDNLLNKCDHFFLQNYVRRLSFSGHVLVRSVIEISPFNFDNDLIDLIMKIPPKFRENHRIYRKFLMKLSPELAKISYNQTGVSVRLPLLFWKFGAKYLYFRERIKRGIFKISRGKIYLPNKRSYVNFNEWLYREKTWKNYFKKLLLSKTTISTKEYINQEYVETLFKKHLKGERSNAIKILYLATFELFLRIFGELNE